MSGTPPPPPQAPRRRVPRDAMRSPGLPQLDATALREGCWEPGAAAAFAAQVAARCAFHGYCVVHNMLGTAQLEAKKADLEAVLRPIPKGRNEFEGVSTQRIYAVFNKTRVMDELATNPVVLGAVEALLRSPFFQLSSPTGIRIGPGETEQPLHRDDNKYPIPKPHPEVVVNTMWNFDDFTRENGATILFPQSQFWAPGVQAQVAHLFHEAAKAHREDPGRFPNPVDVSDYADRLRRRQQQEEEEDDDDDEEAEQAEQELQQQCQQQQLAAGPASAIDAAPDSTGCGVDVHRYATGLLRDVGSGGGGGRGGVRRRAAGTAAGGGGPLVLPREAVPIQAVMPKGSALFYLGSVLHGGGANTSLRPRLGVILEFAAAWLRMQENMFLAVDGAKVLAMPRRLQELLGFNVMPPFLGYVDGRHPLKALRAREAERQSLWGQEAEEPDAAAAAATKAPGQQATARL